MRRMHPSRARAVAANQSRRFSARPDAPRRRPPFGGRSHATRASPGRRRRRLALPGRGARHRADRATAAPRYVRTRLVTRSVTRSVRADGEPIEHERNRGSPPSSTPPQPPTTRGRRPRASDVRTSERAPASPVDAHERAGRRRRAHDDDVARATPERRSARAPSQRRTPTSTAIGARTVGGARARKRRGRARHTAPPGEGSRPVAQPRGRAETRPSGGSSASAGGANTDTTRCSSAASPVTIAAAAQPRRRRRTRKSNPTSGRRRRRRAPERRGGARTKPRKPAAATTPPSFG